MVRVTLFSTRSVFDPTRYSGLPLNIMALMPVLVHHFDQPTQFCSKVVSNIQQVKNTLLCHRQYIDSMNFVVVVVLLVFGCYFLLLFLS